MIIKNNTNNNTYDFLSESESNFIFNSIENIPILSSNDNYILPIDKICTFMENNSIDEEEFDDLVNYISESNQIDPNSIKISVNEGFLINYIDLINNSNHEFILESISDFNPDYQLIEALTEEYMYTEDDNILSLMESTDEFFDRMPEITRGLYDPNVEYPYPNESKIHQLKDKVLINVKRYKDWAKENPKKFGKHAAYAAGAAAGLGLLGHRIAVLRKRMKALQDEERTASYKRKGVIRRLIEKIKHMINKLLGRQNRTSRAYGRS